MTVVRIREKVRERKKRATRQRLYEVAVELFRVRGFDQTPVEAITEMAGTSKGTFFNYFPTKEHVLVAYHDHMTARILDRLAGIGEGSVEDAIQGMMAVCAEWVDQDRVMGRAVVTKIFGTPVLLSADLENTQRFMTWMMGRLRQGIRSGELRSDLDLGLMASMLAGVLSSTLNQWVLDPDVFDVHRELRRRTAFLFEGARAR